MLVTAEILIDGRSQGPIAEALVTVDPGAPPPSRSSR
jgi:hypothetical protein